VKTRAELYERIHRALTAHEQIEEEIFYPALKEHPKARDIVLEGIEEHGVVDSLLRELEDVAVDDETWGPKARVMIENIEHHIEEEEDDMFVKARQVFEPAELKALGAAMATRRAELLAADGARR
jgi:hemerythrin-like domain-containing protein